MIIPKNVQNVWNTLKMEGLQPYLCGGAVRDTILNRTIKDWDFYIHTTKEDFLAVVEKHGFKVKLKSGVELEEYKSNDILEYVYEDENHNIQYMLISERCPDKVIEDFGVSISKAYFDGERVVLSTDFVTTLQTGVVKYRDTDRIRRKYLKKIKGYFPHYQFEAI